MRIDVIDAYKVFDGIAALDRVTFQVASGGRIALVGPNGSGKSTLLRAVMGLVRCNGVRLDGLDAFTSRTALARRIAYVPQNAPITSASVHEVVETVAALRGTHPSEIAGVAEALGLPMTTIGTRPVRALSGGMKQKLLIALALASPASLLVLDEPTASLDGRSRAVFFDLVAARAPQATLLLSSHRPDEVRRLADRVITLEDGRLSADEPAARWLARSEGWQACA